MLCRISDRLEEQHGTPGPNDTMTFADPGDESAHTLLEALLETVEW
jgi:hypothetical protein